MTPTIASILAALSNVGKTPVTIRLTGIVYPVDVMNGAVNRHSRLLALDVSGRLTVHAGVDAWDALRDFGKEALEAAMQTE